MAEEEAAYKKKARAEAVTAKKASQSAVTASSVTEMKHLKNPPQVIIELMGKVSGVLGQEQDWSTSVKLLNDKHFLKTLKTFEIESMDPKAIDIARESRQPQFKPEEIAKKSSAASAFS